MAEVKVMLSKKQIAFIIEMTEIEDKNEAIKFFGNMMTKEGLKISTMGAVIDKIMKKMP